MIFRTLIFAALVVVVSACNPGPPVIHMESDVCAHCMMTISDARFASAIRTSTGKVYRFDSIECMTSYETSSMSEGEEITRWVSDYLRQSLMELSDVNMIVRDSSIRSPMAANLAAFTGDSDLPAGAVILSSAELKEYVASLDMTRGRSSR